MFLSVQVYPPVSKSLLVLVTVPMPLLSPNQKLPAKYFLYQLWHESSSPELKNLFKTVRSAELCCLYGNCCSDQCHSQKHTCQTLSSFVSFSVHITSILQKRPNIKYAGRSLCIPNHSKTSSDCPAFDQNRHNLLICK